MEAAPCCCAVAFARLPSANYMQHMFMPQGLVP